LLFPLRLIKDFLQALSFNSHPSAGSLGHPLREFDPVHSHIHMDTPIMVSVVGAFEKEAIPLLAKEGRSRHPAAQQQKSLAVKRRGVK
jgi:hypothetical protein